MKNCICIIPILSVLLFTACDKAEVRETFYPDGTLKRKEHWEKGKLHGEVIDYFQNSSVQKIEHWENGALNGAAEEYYEDGSLSGSYFLKEGKLEGSIFLYYPNGGLEVKGRCSGGEYIDTLFHYYEDGGPKEKKMYMGRGKLWKLIKYDEKGRVVADMLTPYLENDRDTVSAGRLYAFDVLFGADLGFNVEVLIGHADEGFVIQDTIGSVSFRGKGFTYRYTPEEVGSDNLLFRFSHEPAADPSLDINGTVHKHTFYVK